MSATYNLVFEGTNVVKTNLNDYLTPEELAILATMRNCEPDAVATETPKKKQGHRRTKNQSQRRRETRKHHEARLLAVKLVVQRTEVALQQQHYNGEYRVNSTLDALCAKTVRMGQRLHADLRQEVAMPAKHVRTKARRAGKQFSHPAK